MKKFFIICMVAAGCLSGQQAKAQSFLGNLLSNIASQSASSQTSSSSTSSSSSKSSTLGSVLNSVVSSATGDNSSSTSSLIGNLISSVTGSVTTTQENLVGTWSYSAPAVQFESKNLLTKAGGTTVATKVENKLATLYKMVGIKSGKVTFTFDSSNNVTYTLGSKSFTGTYTFDSSAKTVTITTSTGKAIKAYVTISGSEMSLCFDSTKVLTLFTNVSKAFSSNISSLAGSYDGMKTGFKFTKQ